MKKVKFSVFSDIHHLPNVFHSDAFNRLEIIQKTAEEKQSDFIIHAGDFCHNVLDSANLIKKYNNFHIPSYHCLGNHDSDKDGYEIAKKAYLMENNYYYFDKNGYRIIVLDPNYYEKNGEYINYSYGNYFSNGGSVGLIPPVQLEWLDEVIKNSNNPCILISHQSIERDTNGISNAKEVKEIIDNCNNSKKHSVIMCINGHYHLDHFSILNNVLYFDLNSCSYNWVEPAHNLYPEEYTNKYSLISNTIISNDPIHAVITLSQDTSVGQQITVEGMKSSFFLGKTCEMTSNQLFDSMGRAYEPCVSSLDIVLK